MDCPSCCTKFDGTSGIARPYSTDMDRVRLVVCFFLICIRATTLAQERAPTSAQQTLQKEDNTSVLEALKQHQFDLSTTGRGFLLTEARGASFFMLGELHGENEMPALIQELWPHMWQDGYRYIAAELSPWAANQLEFTPADRQPKLVTTWSKTEVQFVHSAEASRPVLWGCDMDEMQPQLLIRSLTDANPSNRTLERMLDITKAGYKRDQAPELLQLARGLTVKDQLVNEASLLENILATLEIETDRLKPNKLSAQVRRESLMKELFLLRYQKRISSIPEAKVMFRFGRNHLHRGYDDRGISTLGNFIAEFAFSQHKTAFNVAAFGAGGTASLPGQTWDADERGDDIAFAFLASLAPYPTTVFDLRPLRLVLHDIASEDRSALEQRLTYWADSYDAIICYKTVTPFKW